MVLRRRSLDRTATRLMVGSSHEKGGGVKGSWQDTQTDNADSSVQKMKIIDKYNLIPNFDFISLFKADFQLDS